jgi:hypothetical protein
MAKKKSGSNWKGCEKIAAFVLKQCEAEFGLSKPEGKQDITGKSGTELEVDALGCTEGDTVHFLVECKKHEKTAIDQALTGSLACQI